MIQVVRYLLHNGVQIKCKMVITFLDVISLTFLRIQTLFIHVC